MRATALIQADLMVCQAAAATPGVGSIGYHGDWWSASESGSDSWGRRLDDYDDDVYRDDDYRNYGFSARCVRD